VSSCVSSIDIEENMRNRRRISFLVAMIAMLAVAPPAFAQGKGGDKGKQGEVKGGKQKGRPDKAQAQKHNQRDKPDKPDKPQASKNRERGNPDKAVSSDNSGRGRADRFERFFAADDVKPKLRRYAASNRTNQRIAAGALSRGHARGLGDDDIFIREDGDRISLFNRAGALLLAMDDDRARNLGNWRVRPYYDDVQSGAPAFCRSGEGHPVFGREWCLQKGFGLGDYRDLRWGRTTDVGDVVFREVDRGTLARAVLIDVLGDVVFNRLGLHALTLGYSDPLTGVWLGETTGPQVLRVTSGDYPIAEIYDGDRDNRADALVVALRPWY
jgi:hypothetical protein